VDRPLALVVDPDPAVRAVVRDILEEREIASLGASTGSEALHQLGNRAIEMLILDPDAEDVAEAGVLARALALEAGPLVLVTRANGAGWDASWVGSGVFDVLAKPIEENEARLALDRALRQLDLLAEVRRLRRELQSREGYQQLVGRSASMERLRDELDRLAASDVPVWLTGATGTGREFAARQLHQSSSRASAPFVVVDCAAVGEAPCWFAATSSAEAPGLLDGVDDGTVYLDDVTQLAQGAQESLLVAITAGRGPRPRWVAAASIDPRLAVERGQLDEALLPRLAARTLAMPALRDRIEDVAILARHFATTIAEINHLPPIRISPEALSALEAYHWPGNVRELRYAIEHAATLATQGTIRMDDLPVAVRRGGSAAPSAEALPDPPSTIRFREAKRQVVEAFEERYLRDLLRRHEGNVTAASQQAGMLRSALQRLLRKYALKSAEFRTP